MIKEIELSPVDGRRTVQILDMPINLRNLTYPLCCLMFFIFLFLAPGHIGKSKHATFDVYKDYQKDFSGYDCKHWNQCQ